MSKKDIQIDILKEYHKWYLWTLALTFAGSISIILEGFKIEKNQYIFFSFGISGLILSAILLLMSKNTYKKILKLLKDKI